MTKEKSENQFEPDEQRLAALMRTLEIHTPVPDEALLESLRQRAAAKFDESFFSVPPDTQTRQDGSISGRHQVKGKRSMMFVLATRILAGMAAVISAVVLWLAVLPSSFALNKTPFSNVLSELRNASSLHLKVNKVGRSANVWVRAPGLVRWEESEQRYQIAAGSRLWKIDKTANSVVASDSPWFLGPQDQIDLIGLLDVNVTDASGLLEARPVEQIKRDGRDCLVYRLALPSDNGSVEIEATADAESLQLIEILAWPSGIERTGPPLAEMQLVSMNVPVPDEKFEVNESLADDGRIGKISDAQGIVVLRPMLAKRWTPICRETLLRPGDWIRTELRGANAIKVTLSSDVELTLGPGTLLEIISPMEARMHTGTVQAVTPKLNAIEETWEFSLSGPRDAKRILKPGQKLLVQLDRNEKLVDVAAVPTWLAGFEGTSNNESLGSLIVTLPDGRNEPLTVGYHKVSVEIRDQIARTTIEESFVNHTPGRLEGVFHFPLPQDASISGFGMWIGDELVEADVVEKQRAREIYETILRERRDPGLLEWTGGNIFKARVFPIEGRSEKRIKIVYTQVLPVRANQYRYTYGLRSELLRTTPLRELSLSVTINSALALANVTCPTHTARTQQTQHAAQVEFSAQEYAPTRDFEVVCEIGERQSNVVLIPHQRGADGYFLMQLTPPSTDGNWQREVLPDGEPLQVVLLCDTSMSMDSEKRKQQAEFVAAVLASLGPEDRFQLIAADVATAWASPEPLIANAANIALATSFLSDRVSLGWTNLDSAFEETLKRSAANAQIIYIGDGIVSAGDADSAAFVRRLSTLYKQSAGTENRRSLHAITLGNSNDSVVMRGIANMGGGSVRSINGEQTAQVVALELLNEIAQPGLRDLNVEFRGLKVAAVYPERLPNVASGTHQILVGRYLPEGEDQQGEIIVTGKRGAEEVRYSARLDLKGAEQGNSFIPRLWARAHLDQLLAQGGNQAIQDDIIRLSEEFHIITPYTSLLVLETDADRERFGVQRRYEMRDGERFFADGRDNANFELLQQQMKRAGDWRLGMRRQILNQFDKLGRDSSGFQGYGHRLDELLIQRGKSRPNSVSEGFESGPLSYFGGNLSLADSRMGGFGGGSGGQGGGALRGETVFETKLDEVDNEYTSSIDKSLEGNETRDLDRQDSEVSSGKEANEKFSDEDLMLAINERGRSADFLKDDLMASEELDSFPQYAEKKREFGRFAIGSRGEWNGRNYREYGDNQPDYTSWINSLFPGLDAAPVGDPVLPPIDPTKWSPEALSIANSLLRTKALLTLEGGIELHRDSEFFDPRWERSSGRRIDQVLYSPSAWLTRGNDLDQQTIVNYCDAHERSVYSLAFQLGRSRVAGPSESKSTPFGLSDFSLTPLQQIYADWNVSIEPAGDNQIRLVMSLTNTTNTANFTIDTARHVLLKHEVLHEGKVTNTTSFEDFAELGGTWWARRIVLTDDQGRVTSDTKIDLQVYSKEDYSARLLELLVDKPAVQFVREPVVAESVARQRVADGVADFDDRLAIILHLAGLQKWDEMWKQVGAAEQLTPDKPGVRWIRTILLATIRRNEEARQRLIDEARRIAQKAHQDETFLAEFILGQANVVSSTSEFYDVHRLLKPAYERPLVDRVPVVPPRWLNDEIAEKRLRESMSQRIMDIWDEREASSLERLERSEDVLVSRRAIAESMPWNANAQQQYAVKLDLAGQVEQAHEWLQQALARPERSPYDDELLRNSVLELYRKHAQWDELEKWTTEWIAQDPETPIYNSAYSQHLSAMVFNNHLEAAYALADQWLMEGRVEGKMTKLQQLRFDAAMNFASLNLPNLSFRRLDDRWFTPLTETAMFFFRHREHFDIVPRCMSNYYFNQSDAADQLRGQWLNILRNETATLTATQLNALIDWSLDGRIELIEPIDGRKQLNASEVPDSVWEKIAATVKDRWLGTNDPVEKRLLGEAIVKIYSNRFRETQLLPFLRERIVAASDEDKITYTAVLFDTLLSAAWSNEIESEAFVILQKLSSESNVSKRLTVELPALHRLVDAMLANRIAAGEKSLHDQGDLDRLTRKDLAERYTEIKKSARTELSARLAEMAGGSSEPLADWLRLEQIWLDVPLGQNLTEAEAMCWKLLGDTPPKPSDEIDADKLNPIDSPVKDSATDLSQQRLQFLEMKSKQRALATVMKLAVGSKAAAQSVERLLKYVDAGIAHGGEAASFWRKAKFRLLIALDQPDDLERELREWIRIEGSMAPWRQMLARVLAERGKLGEAIQLFEACEKDDLLTASDYHQLSDWYLVSKRRDDYERCRIESFKQMSENSLSQLLYQTDHRWSRTDLPLPSELPEDTLFALRALFEKSANPENYFYQVRSLFGACRDFRLLQMLPDAMLGRSPQQVYGILQNMQSNVLEELRNEAVADEILGRIEKLRTEERTAIDQRSLDLLQALIERKSAEILNQPGPHIEACLVAMQKAFQHNWADGEPKMMAAFLTQWGALPNEKLKAEQLRELHELQQLVPPLSRDHLSITTDFCQLLFNGYGDRDEALRRMEVAVAEYAQAQQGVWPFPDNDIINRYVTLLESANRHLDGEKLLQKFLARPANNEQTKWLKGRLIGLYNAALESDSAVTLGTGRAQLFAPLVSLGLAELEKAHDENARMILVSQLTRTFDTAHRHRLAGTREAVRNFAFETLPAVLKRQHSYHQNTATGPLQVINEVLGSQFCLQYVVERMEQYPSSLELQYASSWNTFGSELSQRRFEVGPSELDERVLNLTIAQLENCLRSGDSSYLNICHRGANYFWSEKASEFEATAERILNEKRKSGRRAMWVAEYFRGGLAKLARAIEILQIADGNGLLNDSEQYILVSWLREDRRFAETIPILEKLVQHHPDSMQYRCDLMAAYFHTQRFEQLQNTLAQIVDHFHTGGRWVEGNVALLASGCAAVTDWKQAQEYFIEAIALHQRANPNSGLNNGTLSNYYQSLAQSETALGDTKEAVLAAMSSIVCWDARHENRRNAIDALRNAVDAAKDLDGFVAQLDRESAESSQENPILRKTIGQIYRDRNQHHKAIAQLILALEFQPNDKETHLALIDCYDAVRDKSAASAQLLKLIDLQQHDLTLYQQLAERMTDNPLEAERAATSIVESSPQEAEPHAALAELRQKQNRWAEAIQHWEKVARYRQLEPTGLLKLAAAQIHEQRFADARQSLQSLRRTAWPSRFADVDTQIRQFEDQLPK